MDNLIKILKIILLSTSILIGIGILAGMIFIYKGAKSGDLSGFLTKSAIETFVDDDKLSPEQKEQLESGDYEGFVNDIGENLTQEQIDCAVQVLGPERANELMVTQEPTPQEVLKLSKCL